jgi:hypothetical protein
MADLRPPAAYPVQGGRATTACALAILASVGGCARARTAPVADALPETIHACETNTATLCATWERVDGMHYRAAWSDGSEATITAVRFDGRYADFRRADATGKSAGMHAVYTAEIVDGRLVRPAVVWFHQGLQVTGSWTATW